MRALSILLVLVTGLVFGLTSHARAQYNGSGQEGAMMQSSKGTFWVNGGYALIKQMFDKDGNKVDAAMEIAQSIDLGPLGSPVVNISIPYTIHFIPVHVGGYYELYRKQALGVQVGADLAFASVTVKIDKENMEIDASAVPEQLRAQVEAQLRQGIRAGIPDEAKSGFTTQGFMPFVRLAYNTFGLAVGYQFDLGPKAEKMDETENSDRQDAFAFRLDGTYPVTPSLKLLGAFTGFITQEIEEDGVRMDDGDVFGAYVGGSYMFDPFELMLVLRYRSQTKARINGQEVPDTDGNSLNLGFALSYHMANMPLTLSVKALGTREYVDYALPLTGKNDLAMTAGLIFEAVYRF